MVARIQCAPRPEQHLHPHATRQPVTTLSTCAQSDWKLCVAPMMEWTDRHCRHFHRLLAPHARLYTEMISTGALLHGPRERLLTYSAEQHPVALATRRRGPSEPRRLRTFARRRRLR